MSYSGKRILDLAVGILFLVSVSWLLIILLFLCGIDTGSNGLFFQRRVGRLGKTFMIYKFRTLHYKSSSISGWGRIMRRLKLDELPQIFNILKGDMSIVGPRPDVPGYYDKLEGEYREILKLKPGLTSEAALKYFNEEQLLKSAKDPVFYNDNVIFPDKVRCNLKYYYNQSLWLDLKIIGLTIKSILIKQ